MIETERLNIRYLQEQDLERMLEYRNKKEVAKYQSWNRYSEREARSRIRYVQKHPFSGGAKDNTQFAIVLKDGTLIGDLHLEALSSSCITIGYTIDSDYWKQGYGRESVRALLDYIYTHYEYTKCIAYIYKANEASRRLLLDLGFKKFDESYLYRDEGYVVRLDEVIM